MIKRESGKPRKASGKLSFQLETCRNAVQLSELSTTCKVESGKPAPTIPRVSRMRVGHALNAAELLAVPAPEGRPRLTLRIRQPDRTVTAEIAAKSLRRAQTAIREAGADNVALVLQRPACRPTCRRSRRRVRGLDDPTMGRFSNEDSSERYALAAILMLSGLSLFEIPPREIGMKVDQDEVTTAITAGRSAVHGDDTAAAEATVRLARRAGPDAVRFLRRVIVTDGGWATVPQRVRASCAVLEVGGLLGGAPSSETRSSAAFREPEGTDGAGEREET